MTGSLSRFPYLKVSFSYLCIELGKDFEVSLEIGGENGLYDEEAEAVELALLQIDEPVVLRVGEQQSPGWGRVVTL